GGRPGFWLQRAISAAQSGATALVPPITSALPSTRTWSPVSGSALPATSGTPRPAMPLGALGTAMLCCQEGNGNTWLTPPPVAPSLTLVSFHTTSLTIEPPRAVSLVPPHASTDGLEARSEEHTSELQSRGHLVCRL